MIEEEKVSTTCRHVGLLFSFALCRGAVGWWLAEVRRLPDRAAVTGAVDNDGQSCRSVSYTHLTLPTKRIV